MPMELSKVVECILFGFDMAGSCRKLILYPIIQFVYEALLGKKDHHACAVICNNPKYGS